MKTVKDYLDFGLVFVDDDMIQAVTGEPSYGSTSLARCLFKCGEYPSGIKLVGSMRGMVEWIPSLFAWRNNDGVKPEYKGDKEIELRNGKAKLTSKLNAFDNEDWSILGAPSDIVKWRPVVLQSESATASPKEDKSMKPVYTAEMHAKGELPPVGAECILIVNDEPRPAKVTYIGKDIVCCSNVDGDAEYACLLGLVSFEPIPKTFKVNGFDVPAPMSAAPEVGAKYFVPSISSDDFVDDYTFNGDSYDKRWLSRCVAHSTKSAAIAHAKAMLGINPNPTRGGDGYDRNVLGQNNEGDEI